MSSDNDNTLQAYHDNIQDYVISNKQVVEGSLKGWIDGVLKLIPRSGQVLEIGSGYGRDAWYMQSQGYKVMATDAVEGFVKLMQKKGLEARKLDVLTDDFGSGFDLVFAQAVFLHFKPDELKQILRKSFDCLKTGGILAFSVKEGEGEGYPKDYLGGARYFRFWKEPDLRKITENAGFSSVEIIKRQGTRNLMLHVTAKK